MRGDTFTLEERCGVSIVTPKESFLEAMFIQAFGEQVYFLLLEEKHAPKLIFDFGADGTNRQLMVERLTVAAFRKFTWFIEEAASRGGRAVFCHVAEGIMDVLQATRLDETWEVYPTLGEAIEALK